MDHQEDKVITLAASQIAAEKAGFPALAAVPKDNNGPPIEDGLLHGKKLAITFACMMLGLLTIAIDQTILATALPSIGADFQSFDRQGWVTSSFIMTQTATILLFGALCRIHVAKYVFLGSLFVFEVGSLIAGVSPSVDVLIFGRALSGVGAAGMMASLITLIAQITTLQQRPKLMGMFGAVFGLSSIIGPLLGGAFTEKVSWRWCFYINLPIGGFAAFWIVLLLKPARPLGFRGDRDARTLWQLTYRLDWIGAGIYFAGIVLIVLALQWAGNEKPWGSPAVICCLVFGFVVLGIFMGWERYMGDKAIVPPSIFKSLSIVAICAFSFTTRFCFLLINYYLPLYYQAIKDYSAVKSAVELFPFMIIMVLTLIIGGQLIARVFHSYYWFLVLGPIITAIGGGLFTLLDATTSNGEIIGFQILLAFGCGLGFQNSNLAIQAEFKDTPKLVAQASSLGIMMQFFGGTIGLALGQTVLSTELDKNLAKYAPGVDATLIAQNPLAIRQLPLAQQAGTIEAYYKSLAIVFVLIPSISGLALISAVFIKNIRITGPPHGAHPAAAKPEASPSILEKGSPETLQTPSLDRDGSIERTDVDESLDKA